MIKGNLTRQLIVTFCVLLTILSTGFLTVEARETLTVNIVAPATNTLYLGDQLELVANASGGPGGYTYQWYQRGNAITDATSANYTFSPTLSGEYTFTCAVTDATGVITGSVTSQPVTMTVTARPQTAQTPLVKAAPSNIDNQGSTNDTGDLGLLTLAAVVGAAAVVVIIVAAVVLTRKRSKKETADNKP